MLPYLDNDSPFPPVNQALDEPNGLLAAGANLSPNRLLDAYSKGIFPWYSKGEPILWWSPNPRMVFNINGYKPSRSLRRWLRKTSVTVTLNQSFERVIKACSMPRQGQPGTWITQEMQSAYLNLHELKKAHSLEVWQHSELVGGIYGVANGPVFCGESMFSRISNASKLALSCLIALLKPQQFKLLDGQVENEHLFSLGARSMPRETFQQVLSQPFKQPDHSFWSVKQLDPNELFSRFV